MTRRVSPNLLDRAIAQFSPKWALKRLQFRQAVALYEGASRGRRTKGWRTPDSSIQSDTRRGLHLLRARSRDLGQNNAYAAAAHRELPANIVGEGITPHVDLPTPELRAPAELLAKEWFDTPICDFDSLFDFYGIQSLIARTVVESGECLVRRVRRPGTGSRIPLQLRVLDPDHIDTMKDGIATSTGMIIQGVEYNRLGQRVAYWLYEDHPGDQHYRMTSLVSRRVLASEVLHIRRIERAGQVRGVPWSAPVLLRLRDFDEYEDAQLVRQKIAACFSVFITPGDQFGRIGNADAQNDDDRLLPEKVEPGMIEMLSDGKDVTFANPPGVQGYGEYSLITLHQIAAGYGIPYSVLTGDLRQVNFSSGRLGDRTFARNVRQWQRNLMIPQLCQPVWRWFMQACVERNLLAAPVPARWSPPRRELTDPAREIPALNTAMRGGQITHPELLREYGYDPDDFVREVQEWNRALDEAGLVFDSDARKTSAAGLTQARQGDIQLPPTSREDDDD